jgi:aryl-alcohol dehydrogenase-like predicted oxidoreductase
MTKQINRKDFIVKTFTGLAGINLISRTLETSGNSLVNYRKLGNTGISVSPLCFGAPRTNDESLIKYAVDKGISFIDTGRTYGNGNNEKLVGRAVGAIRKNVVIQSKIRLEKEEVPSGTKSKKGEEEIRQALSTKLEASLKALNTSYIDVMLIHDALDEKLLFHPETLKFFEEKKLSGVIKACGFSTHNDCMNLIDRNNSEGFYDVVMVPFNHKGAFTHSLTGKYSEWDQNKLIGLLTAASEKGKGVIAMKTCSGGPFSPSNDLKPDFQQAVKWVLDHKFISAAAIAMASFEQVDDHLPLLNI